MLKRERESIVSYKNKLDEEHLVRQSQLQDEINKLQAQEGKLRQWERDLEDIQLQLTAEQAEVGKMKKRYQLTEAVKQK